MHTHAPGASRLAAWENAPPWRGRSARMGTAIPPKGSAVAAG